MSSDRVEGDIDVTTIDGPSATVESRSQFTPDTDALDRILDGIEAARRAHDAYVSDLTTDLLYDAIGMARAVYSLLDFGGGNLRLPDGRVFKLARACVACENAVRMFTRAGLESEFCVRCANDLASKEWARQPRKETPQ